MPGSRESRWHSFSSPSVSLVAAAGFRAPTYRTISSRSREAADVKRKRAMRQFPARNRAKTSSASNRSPRSACSIPCWISRINASRRRARTSSLRSIHSARANRASGGSFAASALSSSTVIGFERSGIGRHLQNQIKGCVLSRCRISARHCDRPLPSPRRSDFHRARALRLIPAMSSGAIFLRSISSRPI